MSGFEQDYNINTSTGATPGGNSIFNYMQDTNIFILDCLNTVNCANLIGDLAAFSKNAGQKQADKKDQFLNIYINSNGGNTNILFTIQGLLTNIRNSGYKIRTNVYGEAKSCASMLAIMGDKGHRTMSEFATHLVHFGTTTTKITKSTEIEKAKKYSDNHIKNMKSFYLRNTKITEKHLNKLMEDEFGFLNAEECLKLHFCDKILMLDGTIKTK